MITLKTYKCAKKIDCSDGILNPESGRLASVQMDVYTNPSYVISGTSATIASGTTTGSTYYYNPSLSATTAGVELDFGFTDNYSTLTASTTTFKYNIYGYNPTTGTFGNHVRGGDFTFPTRSFNVTGTTLSDTISYGDLYTDNEYMVKPSYTYSATTLIEDVVINTLDISDINTPINLTGNTFGLFKTGGTDGYFVVVDNPPTPEIATPQIVETPNDFTLTMEQADKSKGNLEITIPAPQVTNASTVRLLSENFTVGFSGQSEFILNEKADGDVLVTVNGLTLLKNVEYTFVDNRTNTTTVYMASGTTLMPTDTLQMIYVNGVAADNGLTVETTEVSAIASGATGTQPAGAKVFYNTTHNTYEYYLDFDPSNPEDIQMIVNGVDLSYDKDFYQSSTLPNRMIFGSATIKVGDVIAVYYLPESSAAVTNSLTTNQLAVSWSSVPAPTGIPGVFNVQVTSSGDTSYSSVLYSGSTPYVSGQTEYNLNLTITGLNQTYLYRVVSEKTFTTIRGDELVTTANSINGSFDTNNMILNTY